MRPKQTNSKLTILPLRWGDNNIIIICANIFPLMNLQKLTVTLVCFLLIFEIGSSL